MEHGHAIIPNPWMMLPFGLLLATIALGPLFFLHWWEKHYPKVAYVLGAITLKRKTIGEVGQGPPQLVLGPGAQNPDQNTRLGHMTT